MKVIGVTGQAGSGKSFVLKYLEENYNCRILYADAMAAAMQEPGGECYSGMRSVLGDSVFEPDGRMNRKKVAEIVFNKSELLNRINSVVHPAVRAKLIKVIAEEKKQNRLNLLFFESAILIEAGFSDLMDETWYIFAEESVRIKRLVDSRGYDEKKIADLRKNQREDAFFRENCDIIVDNSGTLEETAVRIRELLDNSFS